MQKKRKTEKWTPKNARKTKNRPKSSQNVKNTPPQTRPNSRHSNFEIASSRPHTTSNYTASSRRSRNYFSVRDLGRSLVEIRKSQELALPQIAGACPSANRRSLPFRKSQELALPQIAGACPSANRRSLPLILESLGIGAEFERFISVAGGF
jgi:hypothetical protein